ncbi:hypothetical protein AU255_04070 [Methyloprofundus sedimenti]|uniref:DUF3014 domain-containing protein n=1 Tax=Methyloprofundus sedimenti TaxID=1420851 RepID=A0A1V8M6S0_9GAMM|nr:DUF3014 domain-containing protein [Methyloprofundus sedimenti]OQK17083.1 hypothetical protein AU255_04070 [Methyloprofundus sedimenti]
MQEQNINTSNKVTLVIIGILVTVLLVALLLFLLADEDDDAGSTAQNTEQVLVIPEVESPSSADTSAENMDFASQVPRYDGEALQFDSSKPLPELVNSDAEFTQDLLSISAQLQPSLFKKQLIRKSIFSINDMAQGMLPPVKRLRELSFSQPFTVNIKENRMFMSQASYQRYDQLALAIDAIDNQAAVALYHKYLPLFQQVFTELSYPDNYQVLDIIKSATSRVLDAPVINNDIEVIRTSVQYKFASPELEKLSPLDKQMLRMGPENTHLIQNKLRELVEALIASEKD